APRRVGPRGARGPRRRPLSPAGAPCRSSQPERERGVMPWVEVRDPSGAVVWRTGEIGSPYVERVSGVVRVIDLDTGQVEGTYALRPGDEVHHSADVAP